MRATLSPECRLVFQAAAAPTSHADVLALARDVRDWPRVLLLAEQERAVPDLWRVLRPVAGDVLTGDVVKHLQRSATVAGFRMSLLHERLKAVLARLAHDGVPVILLKGAGLGASVYAEFTRRPMMDVDLLIHVQDAARAREAVLAADWVDSGDAVLARLLEGHHHLPPFVDRLGTGVRLELHTSLLPGKHPFVISDGEIWASAQPAPDAYAGALVPTPRHLLLHACIHFAWSHAFRLGAWRMISDIAALQSRGLIDWDEFAALAQRTRAVTACYWTLRLAARLGGVAVPAEVLRILAPPGPELARRVLERHLVSEIALGEAPRCPSVAVSHTLWRAVIRPGWSGHGAADRFGTQSRWEEERYGVRPDRPSERIIRHVTGVREWWGFVVRTLGGAR